jgi:hypothetical protein
VLDSEPDAFLELVFEVIAQLVEHLAEPAAVARRTRSST